MSLYFITTDSNGKITSHYSPSAKNIFPFKGETVNWNLSYALNKKIPLNDDVLHALDRKHRPLGYINNKLVTQKENVIYIGEDILINTVYGECHLYQGKDCHYIISRNTVYRVDENLKMEEVTHDGCVDMYNGEVYTSIGKKLYKLEGVEMNFILVREYESDINYVGSTAKGLVIKTTNSVYFNHQVLLDGIKDSTGIVCTDKYISVDNNIYSADGELLVTLTFDTYIFEIVEDYAIIGLEILYHIPEKRIVYVSHGLLNYAYM